MKVCPAFARRPNLRQTIDSGLPFAGSPPYFSPGENYDKITNGRAPQ